MDNYFLSRVAQRDIDEIVGFIAEDKPSAAIAVAKAIRKTCSVIGDMPGVGQSNEMLGAGNIYYFPVSKYRNYLIFYVVDEGRVLIVRVIHAKRDIPELFNRWYGNEKTNN